MGWVKKSKYHFRGRRISGASTVKYKKNGGFIHKIMFCRTPQLMHNLEAFQLGWLNAILEYLEDKATFFDVGTHMQL